MIQSPRMDETDFASILSLLKHEQVDFILIGGLAAMAMGSARATVDVDVVYSRDDDNMNRLAQALKPYEPYMRGAPPGLPFTWDPATIRGGLNFTLSTTLGDLDVLGEVAGGGTYEQLHPFTEPIRIFDIDLDCVTLAKLIQLKKAAGRPKDLEVIAELEALQEEGERR